MSTPSHTPEPWKAARNIKGLAPFIATESGIVASLDLDPPSGTANTNATRIVACVNACAGISDPATAIANAVDALNHIRALVVNENTLTYDEIMEHVERHADIGLDALRSSTKEQSQRGSQREESK